MIVKLLSFNKDIPHWTLGEKITSNIILHNYIIVGVTPYEGQGYTNFYEDQILESENLHDVILSIRPKIHDNSISIKSSCEYKS